MKINPTLTLILGKGYSVISSEKYQPKDIIYTVEDIKSDEDVGWFTFKYQDIEKYVIPENISNFEKYCYNVTFTEVRGPILFEFVKHSSNFVNHSCDPNMTLDNLGNWIARKEISESEELTIDYGTILFSHNHNFKCQCGSKFCRGTITKDDWKKLYTNKSLNFPSFMKDRIDKLKNGN